MRMAGRNESPVETIKRLEAHRDAALAELDHVRERARIAESVLCELLIGGVVKLDVNRRVGAPSLTNFQAEGTQITLNDIQGDLVHKIAKAVL